MNNHYFMLSYNKKYVKKRVVVLKKLTVILIGAGNRGTTYVENMKKLPDMFDVVGVAEPIESRRRHIQEMFGIPEENCFANYKEILSVPRFADVAIIATLDEMHLEPALAAIECGYNLLLEKPLAQTAEECIAIATAAKKKGVKVLVCHVLRYTPFYKTVKTAVMDGLIGDVMSVLAVEGVGNVHQSHSYVRGNWKCEDETTPMLLAKCCHDVDIIQWLVDRPCEKVSSFGELTYFKPERAPENAPLRCVDTFCPVRESCPYDINKIYFSEKCPLRFCRWAASKGYSENDPPLDEEVLAGIRNSNYGACVYHAGNDVVDHQIVNMQFEGGVTASLTMNAFNEGGRYIRIFGTKGELYANASDTEITVFTFEDRKKINLSVEWTEESIEGGHGGGDTGIIYELYEYFNGEYKGFCAADIDISTQNHIIAFAAEKARKQGIVENVSEYAKSLGFEY